MLTNDMKRQVKYRGKWYEAEECFNSFDSEVSINDFISEPYYLIGGHIIPKKDVEEIKDKKV
jgi:hypothetical protein